MKMINEKYEKKCQKKQPSKQPPLPRPSLSKLVDEAIMADREPYMLLTESSYMSGFRGPSSLRGMLEEWSDGRDESDKRNEYVYRHYVGWEWHGNDLSDEELVFECKMKYRNDSKGHLYFKILKDPYKACPALLRSSVKPVAQSVEVNVCVKKGEDARRLLDVILATLSHPLIPFNSVPPPKKHNPEAFNPNKIYLRKLYVNHPSLPGPCFLTVYYIDGPTGYPLVKFEINYGAGKYGCNVDSVSRPMGRFLLGFCQAAGVQTLKLYGKQEGERLSVSGTGPRRNQDLIDAAIASVGMSGAGKVSPRVLRAYLAICMGQNIRAHRSIKALHDAVIKVPGKNVYRVDMKYRGM